MGLESKTIAIIAADEFEDIELEFPLLRLSEEGADILLVPVEGGLHTRPFCKSKPVTGRFGTPMPPMVMEEGNRYESRTLEELKLDEIDCILIPGGFSPDQLRVNSDVVELISKAHEKGKLIAAICHGPQLLIEADLVDGRKVTSYEAVETDLINAGGEYVDEPMVKDGNILTSRVPDDLPQFCQGIAEALSE